MLFGLCGGIFLGGKIVAPLLVVAWLAPFFSTVRVILSCTVGAVGGLDLRGWHGLGGLCGSGGLASAATAALSSASAGYEGIGSIAVGGLIVLSWPAPMRFPFLPFFTFFPQHLFIGLARKLLIVDAVFFGEAMGGHTCEGRRCKGGGSFGGLGW